MTNFDLRAVDWDSDPLKVERAQRVAQAIRESVPLSPAMKGLELGCGTGLLSFALQPFLGALTLADSSMGMLTVVKEKIALSGLGGMTPLFLDLTAGKLPDDHYDIIFNLMTLHHIPDTQKALMEMYSLLNHSGFLCISDLDKEDGSFHEEKVDVHHGFDRQLLSGMLEQVGFSEIRFSTVYEITKETAGKARSFPLFLLTAKK